MLIDFQRALADLTASPELTQQMRRSPDLLQTLYDLDPLEFRQLTAVVNSEGMRANCILYRANRLAPLALNLPQTCHLLGDQLLELVSAYWRSEPITNVHFLLETERFCDFLEGQALDDDVRAALEKESFLVKAKVAYSRIANLS